MEIGSIRNGDGTALARGLGWFSMGLGAAELAVPHELARLIGVGDCRPAPIVMRALGAREIASGLGLLIGRERPSGAWARVAGDALDLALLAWAARTHCTHRDRLAIAVAAVLGVTALDVIAGRRLARRAAERPVTAATTIQPLARGDLRVLPRPREPAALHGARRERDRDRRAATRTGSSAPAGASSSGTPSSSTRSRASC